ncbi:MAG: M48 family metalloprotease [Thermoleophilia bacterium]|nr:M48 family metalloprotease [Thermoleophilia bacterium]
MHTQTESTQGHRRIRAILPGAAAGLALYLLTISGEVMLGASVRWFLAYLGAAIAGTIVPLGVGAEGLAWVAALAPIAWSLAGLALPGRGRVWGRRLGARRPSSEEVDALADALETLRCTEPNLPGAAEFLVLDDPLPGAAVRGRALILSRGLLDHTESLPAVLAHELGHADTLDGRLTEALERLALWGDPLASVRCEAGGEGELHDDPRGGLLWGLLRWTLRLAGGSFAQQLLTPLWAAHWRAREYAADDYAASLGQAEDLAGYLADQEQPFDAPQRGLFFNPAEHPPVALRIERLLGSFDHEGSK